MKKLMFLLFLFQFIFSCSSVKMVPEITPDISAEDLNSISLDSDILTILNNGESLKFIDIKGKIHTIPDDNNPNGNIAGSEKGLKKKYLKNDNILILFPEKKKYALVYDINKNDLLFKTDPGQLIRALGRSHYLYFKSNKLDLIGFPGNDLIFSIKTDKVKLLGSDLSENRSVFLFEQSVLIYDVLKKKERSIPLRVKPVSPFLRVSDHIYFGDESRALVKLSLTTGKIIWKVKFQKHVNVRPVRYKELIVVCPEDNNTYLITRRGGIKNWYKLNSGPLFDPVLMKNHLAVFLRTEEGTSINYLGLDEHSLTVFKNKSLHLKSQPVYYKGYLYSAGKRGDDPVLRPVKIGNIFGSVIKMDPEKIIETGKAVRFNVRAVNMKNPDIKTFIINDKEETVFKRETLYGDNPSFAWVPESGGNFTLKVVTKEKDGIEAVNINKFIVTDTEMLYRKLQLKLHMNCKSKKEIPTEQNEKKD